jgi:hypothetical protein
MKLPFQRKKETDVLPTEIKEYYTSEKREKTGAAWLVGAAVFVVTVLVVLGLFYGGRALYRTVFDNDETPATEQTTSDTAQNNDNSTGTTTPGDEEVLPGGTPSADDTIGSEAGGADDANNPALNDDEAATTPPAQTPNTGPTADVIPNTGPNNNE